MAVRQELIALARLHCQFDDGVKDATALARAHVNLGGAYAAVEFWKQAAIHGKRGLHQLEKVRANAVSGPSRSGYKVKLSSGSLGFRV